MLRRRLVTQRRPKGHMWPTPETWKERVLVLMQERGINRAELSRRIKVSDAAITQLFRSSTRTSRLVPHINEVVGLPPPAMTPLVTDEYRQGLDSVWPELGEDDRKLLLDMAQKISQRRK